MPLNADARRAAKDVASADFTVSRDVTVTSSFESMNLKEDLLKGLYEYGYERPSAIQQRAIVPIIQGRDVIAQAQSGTGKSSMIALAACQVASTSHRDPQVLILSPTRELAEQTGTLARQLGEYMAINTHCCIGGKSLGEDIKKLEAGVQVVSGTPGRVYDLVQRKHLVTKKIKLLVLDEADEMLNRGFKEQMYDMYRHLPPDVQVVLISATLPPDLMDVANKFTTEPVRILVRRDELTLDGIRQFHVDVEKEEWKFDTLCDLYDTLTITQSVIFVNTRKKVDWLAKEMRSNNFTVSSMHGEMPQGDRESVMAEFREGKTRVLITTDIWARGIDVQQVSLVVNYDLPPKRESYLHRIGRGGRFGRKGVAITFVCEGDDIKQLKDLERFYRTSIDELPANVGDLM
ncbi:hypothetical protein PPROV_000591200 [Pycnococcus provasolii]|uniref:RNA helicase n=1 Tax=Pycnococcus provasolii TaxID=41880 RepID=A0A830HQ72_9CHLO|nr:hypothetical protein PPROV_000591200 [Pycnococcus provasolii]